MTITHVPLVTLPKAYVERLVSIATEATKVAIVDDRRIQLEGIKNLRDELTQLNRKELPLMEDYAAQKNPQGKLRSLKKRGE